MRKDVKLGFAIGGVLLAVLIVYVLVISGDEKRPEQVTLATSSDSPAKKTDDVKPATADSAPPIAANPAPAAAPTSAPTEAAKPEPSPAESTAAAADSKPTTAPAIAASNGNDHWANGVLDTGSVPLMISVTPQADPPAQAPMPPPIQAEANRSTTGGNDANPGASSNTSTMIATAAPSSRPSESIRPMLASTAGQTHVVQTNETFSSIAAAVYGSSAYYPHLIRANPTIDPRKLHAGMTINLPPVSEVRVDGSSSQSQGSDSTGRTTTSLDPKTQYQVQSGDNLSKISIKLYGKPDHINKIYDLNKAAIGPDMAKVKAGMVLSLPEPPTAK